MAYIHINIVPFDIGIVIRDMVKKDLKNSDEFKKLLEYKKITEKLTKDKSFENTKNNILILLEIYSFLERSNQFLLEKQIEQVFKKYIDA